MTTQSDSRHLARLARGGFASVGGAGVSSVAGIALVAVVTNGFTQGRSGALFATTALFMMLATLTQLGTEIGLVRTLPALTAGGRHADVGPVLRMALLPVLAVSTLVGAGLFLVSDEVAALLVGADRAADGTLMLRCLAAFVPVNAVYTAVLAATRGLGTMRTTVLVDSIGRHALQPLAVLVVALSGGGALALVLAWVGPFIACFGFAVASLAARLRSVRARALAVPGGPTAASAKPALRRQFWGFTGPRIPATIAQVALKRLDIVLVSALRSPEEAAVYTAATRFVVIGQLGVQALQQALGPQVSGLLSQQQVSSAQRLFQTTTAWMMLFAWPIYLVCAVLCPWLLPLFGEGYTAGADVVVILSLSMLVATASGSVDTVLLMSGRSVLSLVNNVSALVVNVGLNLLLIPPLGITGAAIAWSAAIVVRNVLPLVQIRRMLDMSPGGRGAAWVAMAALACFGAVPWTARGLGASMEVVALVTVVLCAPAYAWLILRRRDSLELTLMWASVTRRRRAADRTAPPAGVTAPQHAAP